MQRQSQKLSEFCQSRGAEVVLKAIGKLVAVGITIYVIWHEFPELSEHVNFLMLLMTWGLYGLILFGLDIRQTKEKPIGEKLDVLTEEIKGLREDLVNVLGGKNGHTKSD